VTPRFGRIDDLPQPLRERWAAARVWAIARAPYLATALLALEPVVVDQSAIPAGGRFDLSAFPCDQAWHVYVDAEVLAVADVPVAGFWLLHQVCHLLREHAARCPAPAPGREHPVFGVRDEHQRRWNIAADAEIADDLIADGVAAPSHIVTPESLGMADGLTAEQYWDGLAGDVPEDAPDCGSGCDGQARGWDTGRPGLGAAERRFVAREVAREIRERRGGRGHTSGGWERWADRVLDPVVNWRRVLAAAVRRGVAHTAGRVDFTYQRPSRRACSVPGVVLPALHQPLPVVALVLDTSGSMTETVLGRVLGEVGGVLRGVGLGRRHLRVLCCDVEAYEAQRVLDAGDVRLLGGGGTDIAAGISAAAALRPRPDLVVVFTDGQTPWPDRPPPGCQVLVGLTDPAGTAPGWAVVVHIDEKGR
jgi:predicted metal-dependent peptidase